MTWLAIGLLTSLASIIFAAYLFVYVSRQESGSPKMQEISAANVGGTWDNAKKYIEVGGFGGEGSEAHKAAVAGDTVGDPFKDTVGPSLNTMITVMSLVSLVFAPLIVALLG